MQHIYDIPEIEDWIPKHHYYGNKGYVQNFLDSLSYAIFKPNKNGWIDQKVRVEELKYINNIRNLTLLNRQRDYINKQLKWYSSKIFNTLKGELKLEERKLYWLNIDYHAPIKYPNYGSIEVRIRSLDDEDRIFDFNKDMFDIYSSETNKYKRLHNIKHTLIEKLIFETLILFLQYTSDKENSYIEVLFNTYWTSDLEKPVIELPDIE